MTDDSNIETKLVEIAGSMGLYNAKRLIEIRIAEVERTLGGPANTGAPTAGIDTARIVGQPTYFLPTNPPAQRKKARKLSPEARLKIAEAQKRRWARQKKVKA
jgi:hypothetical protein